MKKVPIGISNRHIHVSEADAYVLFGAGHIFKNIKDLSQPGEYACAETVALQGPKGEIQKVRVIMPFRKTTQIEINMSDTFVLGVKAPVRLSGNLDGTPGITVLGPKGKVELASGVIVAQRHLHIAEDQAQEFGLTNGQRITIKVSNAMRGLLFENVVVRIGPATTSALDFHIDIEEANAAGIVSGDEGEIV